MPIKPSRKSLAAIVVSASALVSIVTYEGYRDKAYIPVPGDVPTVGFGTTEGVKPGDTITPPVALGRALTDIGKFDKKLRSCIKVPLHQYEYDAYLSLSYNIGSKAFCDSTLVRELNNERYGEACKQILRWDRFKGKPLAGLTRRRAAEYKTCIGER